METDQIVLGKELLRAADRAARRGRSTARTSSARPFANTSSAKRHETGSSAIERVTRDNLSIRSSSLMIRASVEEPTPAYVEVLLNWDEELKGLGEDDPARTRRLISLKGGIVGSMSA